MRIIPLILMTLSLNSFASTAIPSGKPVTRSGAMLSFFNQEEDMSYRSHALGILSNDSQAPSELSGNDFRGVNIWTNGNYFTKVITENGHSSAESKLDGGTFTMGSWADTPVGLSITSPEIQSKVEITCKNGKPVYTSSSSVKGIAKVKPYDSRPEFEIVITGEKNQVVEISPNGKYVFNEEIIEKNQSGNVLKVHVTPIHYYSTFRMGEKASPFEHYAARVTAEAYCPMPKTTPWSEAGSIVGITTGSYEGGEFHGGGTGSLSFLTPPTMNFNYDEMGIFGHGDIHPIKPTTASSKNNGSSSEAHFTSKRAHFYRVTMDDVDSKLKVYCSKGVPKFDVETNFKASFYNEETSSNEPINIPEGAINFEHTTGGDMPTLSIFNKVKTNRIGKYLHYERITLYQKTPYHEIYFGKVEGKILCN